MRNLFSLVGLALAAAPLLLSPLAVAQTPMQKAFKRAADPPPARVVSPPPPSSINKANNSALNTQTEIRKQLDWKRPAANDNIAPPRAKIPTDATPQQRDRILSSQTSAHQKFNAANENKRLQQIRQRNLETKAAQEQARETARKQNPITHSGPALKNPPANINKPFNEAATKPKPMRQEFDKAKGKPKDNDNNNDGGGGGNKGGSDNNNGPQGPKGPDGPDGPKP